MLNRWSPHPRYRIYTSAAAYLAPIRQLLSILPAADHSARLESEVCRRFDIRASCCVPMARTGLFFGLLELIRPGQKVILSPLTIVDVVNMVILAGGIPVFADTRPASCSIDPEQVQSLVDADTGAVLLTHLHGESAGGTYEILEICRAAGIPLIEDVAQSFGAKEKGRRLGTIGHLGIYSFGFFKNLNAWRGGLLVSQDKDLIAGIRRRLDGLPRLSAGRLLLLTMKGLLTGVATFPPIFANFVYPIVRYSFLHSIIAVNRMLDPEHGATRLSQVPSECLPRMAPAQALLALKQLDRIDPDSRIRRSKAAQYHRGLAYLKGLVTPEWNESSTYTYYPIQFCGREALLKHAMRRKRDFAAQFLRNCADLPEFSEFYRDCPNAREASRTLILLPTYPRYPDSEIQRNIEVIRDFLTADVR